MARDFFEVGRNGRVLAVFKNSFYLESSERLVCVGNASLGLGPLTAICEGTEKVDWSANGFPPGTDYGVSTGGIAINGRFIFSFAGTSTWEPVAPPICPSRENLRHRLIELDRVAAARLPAAGLAASAFGPANDDKILAAAHEPIAALRRWLSFELRARQSAPNEDLRAARQLLGLGPGLTPSGDDVLGGVMIALYAIGRQDVLSDFWASVRPRPADQVNPISRGHLQAAARGLGSEAIHTLIDALFAAEPDVTVAALDEIDQIGHTSGWDTLAGVVTTLRTFSE